MKLYATVTSERASKGQGGNKEIVIEFMVGSAKASRTVAFVKLQASQTLFDLIYTNAETTESEVLQVGFITPAPKIKITSSPCPHEGCICTIPCILGHTSKGDRLFKDQDNIREQEMQDLKGEKQKGDICWMCGKEYNTCEHVSGKIFHSNEQ